MLQTVGIKIIELKYLSERSAWNQWSNLSRQLFQVLFNSLNSFTQSQLSMAHYAHFGPSGGADGFVESAVGHYFWQILPLLLLLLLPPLLNWHKGVWQDFIFLHGLLTHININIPMKKKISGTPPTPLKRPILGEQKPKWAVSPTRVCATVLKFYMGFLLTKIIRIQ